MKGKYTLTKSPCETFVGSGFRRHQLEVDNLISLFARFEKMSSAPIFLEIQKALPSRKLTYPPDKACLKMIFLFPRWDMLVPWRVTKKTPLPSVDDTGLVQVKGIELQTHFGQILGVDWPTEPYGWMDPQ